jgi:putative transposase
LRWAENSQVAPPCSLTDRHFAADIPRSIDMKSSILEAIGMPRRQRLDFQDAIQYVRLRGREGASIFFDRAILLDTGQSPRLNAPGVRRFEALLAGTCEECGTTLLAYSIEPNAASIVMQITGAPLAAVMRRLSGQYSRDLGMSIGHARFARRYASQVVSPEYLTYAVRRVHRCPVEAGLCRRSIGYPFSSERAYMGEPSPLPLDFLPVRMALRQKGHAGMRGYREFMTQPDSQYVAKLFAQGSPLDARIIGAKPFVQQARYIATHPSPLPTREELIDGVARLLNLSVDTIHSHTLVGARARALVAARGLRSRAATLAEVGRWFSVTGATLGQAIQHHRKQSRDFREQCNWPTTPT